MAGGALLFTAKSTSKLDVHSLPWLLIFILHSMAREKEYREANSIDSRRNASRKEERINKTNVCFFVFCCCFLCGFFVCVLCVCVFVGFLLLLLLLLFLTHESLG